MRWACYKCIVTRRCWSTLGWCLGVRRTKIDVMSEHFRGYTARLQARVQGVNHNDSAFTFRGCLMYEWRSLLNTRTKTDICRLTLQPFSISDHGPTTNPSSPHCPPPRPRLRTRPLRLPPLQPISYSNPPRPSPRASLHSRHFPLTSCGAASGRHRLLPLGQRVKRTTKHHRRQQGPGARAALVGERGA